MKDHTVASTKEGIDLPLLSEWSQEQPDKVIQAIASRGLLLNKDEIRFTLSKMGHTMTMRKLHRKIAIMLCVLGMEQGEVRSTHQILKGANEYCRPRSSLTVDMAGGIMRLMVKWGYVMLIVRNKDGSPVNMYRRTALE